MIAFAKTQVVGISAAVRSIYLNGKERKKIIFFSLSNQCWFAVTEVCRRQGEGTTARALLRLNLDIDPVSSAYRLDLP